MTWADRNVIAWQWGPCADWYNVYKLTAPRMKDTNNDGLADDYGSCLEPDLVVNEAPDSDAPGPGAADLYLVTGESSLRRGHPGLRRQRRGEGSPNLRPCP